MNETQRILKMVEAGTISADQGAELLAALSSQPPAAQPAGYDNKLLRVIVDSAAGDKVNVQLPVGAIKKILQTTGKLPIPEEALQGVELSSMLEAISTCLEQEVEGDFVHVEAADGTTVRVFIDNPGLRA